MRLRSLLAIPRLRLEVVTGEDDLDRAIRWVVTTDLLEPGRYLRGRELVLTGLVWRTRPADSETFVRALACAGVSGLAAGMALGALPGDLVDACRRYRIPLFKVPEDVSFATVTEEIVRRLSRARASDLAAVLDRHRRLVEGTGLDAVVDLVGHCHVLTPTGRVVAGPPPPDPAALAGEFLTAPRLPHHAAALGMSLFPVAAGAVPRVADWFIASEGDFGDWPPERRALVTELAAIVAIERGRLESPARRDGEIVTAAAVGDVTRLRYAGLADGSYVAVAASGRGSPRPDGPRPDELRPDDLRAVLAEILPNPRAVGVVDGEVIALVPATGHDGRDIAATTRAGLGRLAPGLPGGGVAAGVSDVAPFHSLRTAVEEARYARRLAAARSAPFCVVRHDELAMHVLLLAGAPDGVRDMFRARLLEPLREYDRTHGADLVRTLETFLQNSGSWTRCAERLHLHVNSVRYRIQRVQDLTGRDLSRLEDRVDFFLALRLMDAPEENAGGGAGRT